jgi:hypothetical protein
MLERLLQAYRFFGPSSPIVRPWESVDISNGDEKSPIEKKKEEREYETALNDFLRF